MSNKVLEQAEKKFRKGMLTLYEFRELETAIYKIQSGESITTICSSVMEFFKGYDVKIFVNGIGWKIEV